MFLPKWWIVPVLCLSGLGCVSEIATQSAIITDPEATESDTMIAPSKSLVPQLRDFVVIGTRLLAPHHDLKRTTIFLLRKNKPATTFDLPKNEFKGAVIFKDSLFVLTTVFEDNLAAEFLPSKISKFDLKNQKFVESILLEHSSGLVFSPTLNKLLTVTINHGNGENMGWTLIHPGDLQQSTFQQFSNFSALNENGISGSDSLVDVIFDASTGKIATLHKSVIPNIGNQGKRHFLHFWSAQDLHSMGNMDLSETYKPGTETTCYPQPQRISVVPQSRFLMLDSGCDRIYSVPSSLNYYNNSVKLNYTMSEEKNGLVFDAAPFDTITFPKESGNAGNSWTLFRNETPDNLGIFEAKSGKKYIPEKFSVTPLAFDRTGVLMDSVNEAAPTQDRLWTVVESSGSDGKANYSIKALLMKSSSAETMSVSSSLEMNLTLPFEHGETPLFLQTISAFK